MRSFHHRLNQGDPEFAFFEFHDAIDGAASGRGNRVFQQSGVVPCFQDNACGTFHGLGGKERGDIARKADLHACFGK